MLTERKSALQKARPRRAHGESRASIPVCGAQDTFYVGLKAFDIYPPTFSTPIPSRCAKLYDRKTPITAADLLNDRILPFFEEHESSSAI